MPHINGFKPNDVSYTRKDGWSVVFLCERSTPSDCRETGKMIEGKMIE